MLRVRFRVVLFLVLLMLFNCDTEKDLQSHDDSVGFRFGMSGDSTGNEDFIAVTTNNQIIEIAREQLILPIQERTYHIHGLVTYGNDGYNLDWEWHFIPEEWVLVEESTEVCDINPLYIKDLLDSMPDTLESFPCCPLSSYIKTEVQ